MSRTEPGYVHSFDLSTGVDGPGTRFVTFLAGCPLRCLYCHSPDTWHRRNGRPVTTDALMAEVAKYQRFLTIAKGGVTVSGGEPLLQPRFCTDVFQACHDAGLHTALDTSGYLGHRADDMLLAATDLVLLDIKSFDPATYRRVTRTGEVAPTLRFAQRLAELGKPIWIRFVLVPGLTDDPANIDGLAAFASRLATVQRVDVLPFHRLGTHKYERLGRRFPLAQTPPPTDGLVERVRGQFLTAGLAAY